MDNTSRFGFFSAAGITALTLLNVAAYAQTPTSLLEAASKNDVVTVRKALDGGTAVNNVKDANGWTPLIVAARNGAAETVVLLLERGANANLAGKTGYTPLMAAAEFGDPRVVRALLLHGADPNKATPRGMTPLMIAASNKFGSKSEVKDLECVKLLLRGGADPDKKHASGATALSAAESRKATLIAAYLRQISGKGGAVANAPTALTDGTISGTLAYRERIGLSPAAFGVVRLLNTSGKTPTVVAQTVVLSKGKQVPWQFSLPYKAAALTVKPGAKFALDARIIVSGTVVFRTAAPVPALTTAPTDKKVALMLVRAGEDSARTLAAEAISATDKALALGGTSVSGRRTADDMDSRYTATLMGGKLVRLVVKTTQGNYGNRTDRFYFSEATDKGYPALRAAYLSAHRLAREAPPMNTGDNAGVRLTGSYEDVQQTIIFGDDDAPLVAQKTIDKQRRNVEPLDITAARNFSRLFIGDLYRTASKNNRRR